MGSTLFKEKINVLVRGMALLKKLQRPTLWIYLSLNWHIRHHADPSAIIFVKESCWLQNQNQNQNQKEDGTDIYGHMAIYMWKILKRKVPNFSPHIQCHISDRRGRLCSSGVVPTGHLGTLCHNSFRNRAATLFNFLPKHIRNIVNCANPIMF